MKKPIIAITCALVVTILFGTIEVTIQQVLRMDANDPQIQLAENAANALSHGIAADTLTNPKTTFPASELTPFVVIYDKDGKVVSGDVRGAAGQILTPPLGVLTSSQGKSYNSVTWQPTSDIRLATITTSTDGYYVLSARSLKEIELRENNTMVAVVAAWLGSLVIMAAGTLLTANVSTKKSKNQR